jgi:hypothetical protein
MSFINEGMVRETAVDETLFIDGFDHCIISVVESFHGRHAVYSLDKVIQTLMNRDGMTREEAVEFYQYNILGAFMGDMIPMFDLKTSDVLW